jgi:hypothetical protein
MPLSKFGEMIEKAIEAGYIEESGFSDQMPMEQLQAT